jgi:hypothetical protein
VKLIHGHRTLDAGQLKTTQHLVAVKHLTPSIGFDHHEFIFFNHLIRGKSLPTGQTFPASAYGATLLRSPGVDDMAVHFIARRTSHRTTLTFSKDHAPVKKTPFTAKTI